MDFFYEDGKYAIYHLVTSSFFIMTEIVVSYTDWLYVKAFAVLLLYQHSY